MILDKADDVDQMLQEAGLDLMPYRNWKYRIRLTKGDLAEHEATIKDLLRRGYDLWRSRNG